MNLKTIAIFSLSPLVSFPLILRDIYNQKSGALSLLVVLLGILSYLYIPSFTNDKMAYFELHNKFTTMDINQFVSYIFMYRNDFAFYLIIFAFAKLGFSFSFSSFVITSITMFVFLLIFKKTIDKYNLTKMHAFYFFLLYMLSFSLPMLFSGMRFYLALSFALWGMYNVYIENNIYKGLLLLMLAAFSHFSVVVFVPLTIIFYILSKKPVVLKLLFFLSFIFLLGTKEFMYEILSQYIINDTLSYKMKSYLLENDLIEQTLASTNFNAKLIIFTSNLWYYIICIYMLINIKRNNAYLYFVMTLLILNNIVYSSPTMFTRYGLLTIPVFILLLIHDLSKNHRNVLSNSLFSLTILLVFVFNLIILREPFDRSYVKYEVLTLPSIFLYEPMGNVENLYKRY